MNTVLLRRETSTDEGTFGRVISDDSIWISGELPWRDNLPGKSCIPRGIYTVTWRNSLKHGMCYHVENVPERTDIEIHPANYVGDKEKKFISQLLGCIALGHSVKDLNGQKAVIDSRKAVTEFEQYLAYKSFELIIEGV